MPIRSGIDPDKNRLKGRKLRAVLIGTSFMSLSAAFHRLRQHSKIGSVRTMIRARLASIWRPFLDRVTFIAVTGSCGKTTTVELLGAILAANGPTQIGVRFNTARAINKTVLRTRPGCRWCVQELSGNAPGRVGALVRVLRPKVGIVTLVGTDHLSAFHTPDAIAQEKGQLIESLPADGLAILNADDPRVAQMGTLTKARVVTFGLANGATLRATEVTGAWPDRLSLTVWWQGKSRRIHTQLIGEFWTTSILAALACALECGIQLDAAASVIESFQPIYARNSPHTIDRGPVFVVDTAKAPFGTIGAAIDLLATARAPRKTLVLGNISDYAGAGGAKYRKVARDALATGARVVGVGSNAATIGKLKSDYPKDSVATFATSREARDFLAADARPGEMILLKSAASGHVERIVLNWANLDDRCWVENCGLKYCKSCRFLENPKLAPQRRQARKGTVSE